MKNKDHIAMGALWDTIAYERNFPRAKETLLRVGIEGPTPEGRTPLDAALSDIPLDDSVASKRIFNDLIEFISWAFEHGAIPRVGYLSTVASISDVNILPVVALLLKNQVPVELDVIPPPDPDLVRLNDEDPPYYRLEANEGFSPLHYAAEAGSVTVTEFLLDECGASIEKRSTYGMTPLLVACRCGQMEVLKALLDRGADTNAKNVDGVDVMRMCAGETRKAAQMRDLLALRARYRRGSLVSSNSDYRSGERIHRTARGDLVRSKSEVIIADALFYIGCDYLYEEALIGGTGSKVVPDFVIRAPGKTYVWEHAGMMGNSGYRDKWEKKLAWYDANGYKRDVDLFLTMEDEESGIDSQEVREIALRIKELVSEAA